MEDKSTENSNWQRVVRITKYEQPPPGFHGALRNKIRSQIAEIEAERAQPWWRRLMKPITGRPALIWANAVTVVGLGFVGLSLFEAAKNPQTDIQGKPANSLTPTESGFALTPAKSLLNVPVTAGFLQPAQAGLVFRGAQSQMLTQSFVIPVRFSYGAAPFPIQASSFEGTNPMPVGLFQTPSSQSYPAAFHAGLNY